MRFVAISDVHIKEAGDDAEKLLLAFLNHEKVQNADAVYLIGDIFDLMIGPHSQYFSRFQNFFNQLKSLLEKNKKIYYIEGNHDFHLKKLYDRFFKTHHLLDKKNFQLGQEFKAEDNGKRIIFCHGDEVEIDNKSYRIFKAIVTSKLVTYYANNLMPYFLIKRIGEGSSKASRKRNLKRYSKDSDLSEIKEKFRLSAEMYRQKNHFDIIVCGHSHVKDLYQSENKFIYVNNGYAQHTQTFILIEDGTVSFENIF